MKQSVVSIINMKAWMEVLFIFIILAGIPIFFLTFGYFFTRAVYPTVF